MNTPSQNNESGWAKKAVAVATVAGAAGWLGAEPMAKYYYKDEAGIAPEEPTKPAPAPAVRQNVDVAIGFDVTRSEIMNDLPAVTAATRDYLEKTQILKAGDKVTACEFAEEARCKTYTMPEGKKALIHHIGNIQPEAPRAGMQTFVHHAVAQMTNQVKEQNGLVLAWTDGYDEKKGKQDPLPENHAPITIVVPKAKFLPKAESVKSTLGKKDVNVLVAANSTEFGELLDKFVSKLDKDAEQKAKVDAEKQYASQLATHAERVKAYTAERAAHAEKAQAVMGKIDDTKSNIKLSAGALTLAAGAALGLLLKMRNRPKLTGYIVNSEGEYVETYKIPPVQEEISLNKVRSALPGNISLKPGKDGVYMNGKKLRSGELIGPNLYWVEKEPDDTELTKYQPVDKSSGDFFNL